MKTKQVNNLLKKSFGILYSGNWDKNGVVCTPEMGWFPDMKGEKLNNIGRKKIGPLSLTVGCILPMSSTKLVGKFTNSDGSALEVKEKYKTQAEKYAELYRQETGKNVSITVLN